MSTLMRVLVVIDGQLQALPLGMYVAMIVLAVIEIIVMRMASMPETEPSAEFMGFRNINRGLEIPFPLDKRELLALPVGPGGGQ
ncbi:hypothetical protein D3C81_1401230 [compost metagenome]